MNDSERLNEVINWTGKNPNQFADSLGFDRSQRVYNVLKKKHGISKALAKKITTIYCNINEVWLLTGIGSMLIDENNLTENIKFKKSFLTVNEQQIKYNVCPKCLEKIREVEFLKQQLREKSDYIEILREKLSKCLDEQSKGKQA